MEASAQPAYGRRRDIGRSPAQVFCLVIGATLVIVGIVGFFAESAFDTGSNVQGSDLIIFEVNGWHNIVHLASGLFLLALAGTHETARVAALLFGAVYAVVTVIGLIDGNDVIGLLPINAADNVLHLLLTVAAFAAALAPVTRAAPRRAT
jgi:Domain of unknown function (DUF4383)